MIMYHQINETLFLEENLDLNSWSEGWGSPSPIVVPDLNPKINNRLDSIARIVVISPPLKALHARCVRFLSPLNGDNSGYIRRA